MNKLEAHEKVMDMLGGPNSKVTAQRITRLSALYRLFEALAPTECKNDYSSGWEEFAEQHNVSTQTIIKDMADLEKGGLLKSRIRASYWGQRYREYAIELSRVTVTVECPQCGNAIVIRECFTDPTGTSPEDCKKKRKR